MVVDLLVGFACTCMSSKFTVKESSTDFCYINRSHLSILWKPTTALILDIVTVDCCALYKYSYLLKFMLLNFLNVAVCRSMLRTVG